MSSCNILIVKEDVYEKDDRTMTAIKAKLSGTFGCITIENPTDAARYLRQHHREDIAGVISALKFSTSKIRDIGILATVCEILAIPFVVCISNIKDRPSNLEIGILEARGIKFTIAENDRDWEKAIDKLGL